VDLEGHGRTALRVTPMRCSTAAFATQAGTASRARLAIVPGYTHYNFAQGPDAARVIEAYLDRPTSTATQLAP
jgi:hypothetical protein